MSDERPDGPDRAADPDAEASPSDGAAAESAETDRPPSETQRGADAAGDAVERDRPSSGTGSSENRTDDESDGEATQDPSAYTTGTRTLDPDVRWLWVGRALVFAAIVGGLATGALLAAAPDWIWVGPVVFGLAAVLGIGHSLLLYRSWSYEVREESLFLDRGVLTRVRTVVPYVRVQHVDTSRGPIERAVGLSSLVVYTAGSRGADVTVPGLTPEEADDLQDRLKVLAIESEGDDAV